MTVALLELKYKHILATGDFISLNLKLWKSRTNGWVNMQLHKDASRPSPWRAAFFFLSVTPMTWSDTELFPGTLSVNFTAKTWETHGKDVSMNKQDSWISLSMLWNPLNIAALWKLFQRFLQLNLLGWETFNACIHQETSTPWCHCRMQMLSDQAT